MVVVGLISFSGVVNCKKDSGQDSGTGMSGLDDGVSQKNALQIAVGSKDHSTLVAAVKAADLVDSVANPGPLTVFAPVNSAFEKLPKGTVEDLLKPSKKHDLVHVLEYHVCLPGRPIDSFTDGEDIEMANGDHVVMKVKNGKVTINGANIVASIPASNGWIHVIDSVLLPPAPKK